MGMEKDINLMDALDHVFGRENVVVLGEEPVLEFQLGDIVENEDGLRGVIVPQMAILSEDGPYACVMEGDNTGFSVDESDKLKVVGHYNPSPNLDLCSGRAEGGGKAACVFAGIGPDGVVCQRFSYSHWSLAFFKTDMRAKRIPGKLYPECLTEQRYRK